MNKRAGTAQLFVLIIMSIMSLIISSLLYVSKDEADVTYLYKETGNLYDIAASGAELTVTLMNQELKQQQDEIIKEARKIYSGDGSINAQIYRKEFIRLIDLQVESMLKGQKIGYALEEYSISVEISVNTSKSPYTYTVISKAQKSDLDVSTSITAEIVLSCGEFEITEIPEQNSFIAYLNEGPEYKIVLLKQTY